LHRIHSLAILTRRGTWNLLSGNAVVMRRTGTAAFLLLALLLLATTITAGNWPGWRGDGTGISHDADPPLSWSDTENVQWKTPIPGKGFSSPIIHGDRAFVTTATKGQHRSTTRGMLWGILGGLGLLLAASLLWLAPWRRSAEPTPGLRSTLGLLLARVEPWMLPLAALTFLFGLVAAETLINAEGEWARRFVFGSVARAWLLSGLVGGCGLIGALWAARDSTALRLPITLIVIALTLYFLVGIPDPKQFEAHPSRLPELSLAALGFLVGLMAHSRHRLWWGLGAGLVAAAAVGYGAYLEYGVGGISQSGHLRVRFVLGLVAGTVFAVTAHQLIAPGKKSYPTEQPRSVVPAALVSLLFVSLITIHFYGAHFLLPGMGIDRLIIAVDLPSGRILWQQGYSTEQEVGPVGSANSYATPTPVTDGERVYAYFGAAGAMAVDYDGSTVWLNRSLPFDAALGAASSPVLGDGLLCLACDNETQSYVTALDAKTGKTRWLAERDSTEAFATPLLHTVDGASQLLVVGGGLIAGYDSADGREMWSRKFGAGRLVPSMVAAADVAFVGGTYANSQLTALQLSSDAAPSVLWRTERKHLGYSSPLIADGSIYMVTNEGVASRLNAATGEVDWRGRVPGNYTASPVMARGRIYFLNTDGAVTVVAAADRFRILAENAIGENSIGSLAVAGTRVLLRTVEHLWCLEKK